MTDWQYKVFDSPAGNDDDESLAESLDQYGRYGWELVGLTGRVAHLGSVAGTTSTRFVFKRPVEQDRRSLYRGQPTKRHILVGPDREQLRAHMADRWDDSGPNSVTFVTRIEDLNRLRGLVLDFAKGDTVDWIGAFDDGDIVQQITETIHSMWKVPHG